MVNVIIDFNNIAMRAMNICVYMHDSGVTNYNTQEECDVLARRISIDMAYILRIFCPDRVIIACDAKHPWREKIYEDIPGMEYKGNRVKDENKNWNNIFKTINDLKDIYEQKGFIVCEIEHTEADDLAALYKNLLYNDKNESVIFVSSDRDWCQLIDYNKNNNLFCIVYNPVVNNKGKNKIYVTNACYNWVNTPEIPNIFFSNYNKDKELIHNIMKDSKSEVEVVDPEKVLTEKIVCGDDGDNIPGFYDFYSNGKKMRFTELRMRKMFESAGVNNLQDFESKCTDGSITEHIAKLFKREIIDFDTKVRLMRQRKLVELNPALFPQDEIDIFNEKFVADMDTAKGHINNVSTIKMEDLLNGTDYVSENYQRKPRENAIFNELKKMDKITNSLF